MRYALCVLMLASSAFGGDFAFTKAVNIDVLEKELRSAGYLVVSTECTGDKCVLHLGDGEIKDPAPVIAAHSYLDPRTARDSARSQAIVLAKKLKAGTATAAEKDGLLLRLCFLLLSPDQ